MKRTTTFLVMGIVALLQSACASGSGFQRQQTLEQTMRPYSCENLHMKNAQWHFVDDFGQKVDVIGTCKQGMKHGNFTFSVNGRVVATVKYNRDNEVRLVCALNPTIQSNLGYCMEQAAKISAENLVPVDANTQSDFLDEK